MLCRITVLLVSIACYSVAERRPKILVYVPKFGHSHVSFMGMLADVLAQEAFDVTTLISDIDPAMHDGTKNTTIIRIPPAVAQEKGTMEEFDLFEGEVMTLTGLLQNSASNGKMFSRQCKSIITDEALLRALRSAKYDVLITEAFDHCGIGLSHLIKAKSLITVSSTFLFGNLGKHIGIPWSLEDHGDWFNIDKQPRSIIQRVKNFYFGVLVREVLYSVQDPMMQAVFTEVYPDMPTIKDLASHSSAVFTNHQVLTAFAHPTLSKVHDIGGIAVRPAQQLDENWSEIVTRRNRTVLISFGSICKSVLMKPYMKRSILKALSNIPSVTFIWKYENTTDDFAAEAARVNNVVLSSWLPQTDILGSGKLSLFVTHGGMGSLQEATTYGVPLLVVPIFGDQSYNAGVAEHIGVGVAMKKELLSHSAEFESHLRQVLYDEKYSKTARRLSKQIEEMPFKPREVFVRNVAFAAKFGEVPNQRPISVDKGVVERYMLDVFGVVLAALFITVYITQRLITSLIQLKKHKIE